MSLFLGLCHIIDWGECDEFKQNNEFYFWKQYSVFALVEKVRQMDLNNEESIRQVIRDVSKIAGKSLDKAEENKLVRDILTNGINENLFDAIK